MSTLVNIKPKTLLREEVGVGLEGSGARLTFSGDSNTAQPCAGLHGARTTDAIDR